ncbi:MAG: citrate synthase [Myxococcaceae bacterium]|nr:citrate synthase [Myxococcaceae bacterium]
MSSSCAWISAREAAARLDVKLATLYAYASRGLIESVPAAGGRGRRYAHEAVERLKARHDARAGHAAVAAGALRFGEPTLETSISEIRSDGPYYRGLSAIALADGQTTFEAVCDLLWQGQLSDGAWPYRKLHVALPRWRRESAPSAVLAAAVACAALGDPERHAASDAEEHLRARRLLHWLIAQSGRAAGGADRGMRSAQRVLVALGVRPTERASVLIDRALILCADHELNPSTFAARVTASTGADLYACLGSALHTLSGPRHGGVSARIEALLHELAEPAATARVVRARHARGEQTPGFGHPLYPTGDPRGRVLMELAELAAESAPAHTRARVGLAMARVRALVTAMKRAQHPGPNFDLGLVALSQALGLPPGAPALLFALGRLPGWVAHALEQRAQGYLLRPRSRYVPAPG